MDYIGVDVSKATLDIWSGAKGHVKISNDANAVKKFFRDFSRRKRSIHVVIEPTGGFEQLVLDACFDANIAVSRVNAKQVRDLARGLGVHAKTDKLDAQMLARYGEIAKPLAMVKPSDDEVKLKQLVARRTQLVAMQTMEKNRVAAARREIKSSIDALLLHLKKAIEEVDAMIADIIHKNPDFKARDDIMQSIKGVGINTSATLLACLPELGKVDGKQIAAIAGLAPITRESGTFKGKSMCFGGREQPKNMLFMATKSAVQHNPYYKQKFDALLARGKPYKVAMVAIMRQMLVAINAMIKNNQKWMENQA